MTDALQDLKKELEKSVFRHQQRLATLSSLKSPSLEEKKAKKKVQTNYNKTTKQLQQLSSLLDPHIKRTFSTACSSDESLLSSDSHTESSPERILIDTDHDKQPAAKGGSEDGKIHSIVILVAMEQEAKPFLERHRLVENVRRLVDFSLFHLFVIHSHLNVTF
jgi:hypothetical protein